MDNAETAELFLPITKLSKDLKAAARNLGDVEARFLVDAYYLMQDQRIRSAGQIRSMDRGDQPEPHAVLDWLFGQSKTLEDQVKLALFAYAKSRDLGQWLLGICGIGPVIAAGLLAHVDWARPTAGAIWRYAGLDPTCKWEKGEKRPWNASLKVLMWKAGESFIKVQNNKNDVYGKEYALRKQFEVEGNDSGRYVGQAQAGAERVKKTTEAWPWYAGCYPAGTTAAYIALASVFPEPGKLVTERGKLLKDRKVKPGEGQPMLPPNHINSRARRYAVKLFLSHTHFVGHFLKTGRLAPNPYPLEHCGHVHMIMPPNLQEITGLQDAWEKRQRDHRDRPNNNA